MSRASPGKFYESPATCPSPIAWLTQHRLSDNIGKRPHCGGRVLSFGVGPRSYEFPGYRTFDIEPPPGRHTYAGTTGRPTPIRTT